MVPKMSLWPVNSGYFYFCVSLPTTLYSFLLNPTGHKQLSALWSLESAHPVKYELKKKQKKKNMHAARKFRLALSNNQEDGTSPPTNIDGYFVHCESWRKIIHNFVSLTLFYFEFEMYPEEEELGQFWTAKPDCCT